MIFEKCIACPQRGKTCAGPNFSTASVPECLEWIEAWQQHDRISNTKISELTGIPKSTWGGIKSGSRKDVGHETLVPVFRMIAGDRWEENPCANPGDESELAYADRSALLQEMQTVHSEADRRVEYLKKLIRWLVAAVIALAVLLAAASALLIRYLSWDKANPHVGIYWDEPAPSPRATVPNLDTTP